MKAEHNKLAAGLHHAARHVEARGRALPVGEPCLFAARERAAGAGLEHEAQGVIAKINRRQPPLPSSSPPRPRSPREDEPKARGREQLRGILHGAHQAGAVVQQNHPALLLSTAAAAPARRNSS